MYNVEGGEYMNLDISLVLWEQGYGEVCFPVDYHSNIVSLLKYVIKERYPEKYEYLFESNRTKYYTWALKFPNNARFSGRSIVIPSGPVSLDLRMRFHNKEDAEDFQSAFLWDAMNSGHEDKYLFGCTWEVTRAFISNSKEYTSGVVVKTMSNIACEMQLDGRTRFLSVNDGDTFIRSLKHTLAYKANEVLEGVSGITEDSIGIDITPGKAREVYNTIYGAKLPVTAGTFKLTGNKEIINLPINGGLGSITGSGFGMVRVIDMV